MARIVYQSFDGTKVGGGEFTVDGDVTLTQATALAGEHAGRASSVDVLAAYLDDGRELVGLWEESHSS